MRDFESYYAAGQAFAAHVNPYAPEIWTYEQRVPGVNPERPEVLPFVGPPAFLPLWALFGMRPYNRAVLAWGALLLALSAMVAIVILVKTRAWSAGALLATAALFTAFGPYTSDLALGQAALLSFAACIGATVMFERAWGVASVWAFFAALQPNVALVLLSQITRRRGGLIFGTAVAAFIALSFICIRAPGTLAYIAGLREHAAAERFALIQITPASVAYGFGAPPLVASVLGIITALFAAGCVLAILRNASIGPLWKLALVCSLLPFAVPFFHEHDFVVLLLPLLLCLLADDQSAWPAASAGGLLVAIDWLGAAQRPEAFAQMMLLGFAAACSMVALSGVPLRRALVPIAVLPVALLAHVLALNAPAPVWPDAMRAGTRISADIAQTWHAELSASGQFTVQPLWAALRLLTLAGCALIAWAAHRVATSRDQFEML